MLLTMFPVLLLTALSCSKKGPDGASGAPAEAKAVTVRVTIADAAPFTETIEAAATVKALDDVMLSPEEGGVLAAWTVERGATVTRGTVIGRLKDDLLKPGYAAAAAQESIAAMNYAKQERVYAEQAISELQYKSSGFTLDAARAQADLLRARWAHTRITSPIDGILDDRFIDEGEMAAPGVPVARIVNIASVRVQANLSERLAGSIARNTAVQFSVAAYAGRVFSGKIAFIGSTLSPDNKTFLVEAIVPNPGRALKPEMVGRMTILRASRDRAILIPEEVIQQIDRNRLVVYVETEGKAIEKAVECGARSGSMVEITAGLAPGDRIITAGFKGLVNGQSVTLAE
jgi:RND family efflux transporter MFP subunit